MATGELLVHHPVTIAAVLPAVASLRSVLGPVAVALETPDGAVGEHAYTTTWDPDAQMPRGDLTQLLADHPTVFKVLVRGVGLTSDEMLAAARAHLDGSMTATHSNARGGGLLEISASGISKAATLAELAAQRGLSAADVVAFGDMPNDVEMLVWAGRGVAMVDGHPEAIAAADEVAPPLAEDGVAQVLERLLAEL
jgi:hydroxymethylpyrimidine pyrophosphatase-like HAD family hydrolase